MSSIHIVDCRLGAKESHLCAQKIIGFLSISRISPWRRAADMEIHRATGAGTVFLWHDFMTYFIWHLFISALHVKEIGLHDLLHGIYIYIYIDSLRLHIICFIDIQQFQLAWAVGAGAGATHEWLEQHFCFGGQHWVTLPFFCWFGLGWSLYLGWSPFPVIVTTRIITFLVGNPILNLHFHYYWEGGQPNLYQWSFVAKKVQGSGWLVFTEKIWG